MRRPWLLWNLLKHLKHLETELGRLPSVRWGPRLIDMDILFYDDLILDTPELIIPHPHLHERAFVLVPAGRPGTRSRPSGFWQVRPRTGYGGGGFGWSETL